MQHVAKELSASDIWGWHCFEMPLSIYVHTKLCVLTHTQTVWLKHYDLLWFFPSGARFDWPENSYKKRQKIVLLSGWTDDWICQRKRHKIQFQSNKLKRLYYYDLYFHYFCGQGIKQNSCVSLADWTIEKFMQLLSWNVFDSFQF